MLKDMSLTKEEAKEYSGMTDMKAVSINITAQDANAASDPQVKEFLRALSDRVSGMIKKNTLERIELSMLVNGSVMTKTTFDGQDVSVEVVE